MGRRVVFAGIGVLIVAAILLQLWRGRHGAVNIGPAASWATSRGSAATKDTIAELFSLTPATRLVPNTKSLLANGPTVRAAASASVAPPTLALSLHELFHGSLLGTIIPPGTPPVSVPAEQQMLADLNTTRIQRKLPELKLDQRLSQVALAHAHDMVQHGFFSHSSSNGDGPFERMRKARVAYVWAGENLAESPDERSAYDALLKSPEHLANIVQPHYAKVGIAAVQAPGGEMLFVEEFTN